MDVADVAIVAPIGKVMVGVATWNPPMRHWIRHFTQVGL